MAAPSQPKGDKTTEETPTPISNNDKTTIDNNQLSKIYVSQQAVHMRNRTTIRYLYK